MKIARTRKERVRRIEFHLRNYRQYLIGIKNIERHARLLAAESLPSITASYELREGSVGAFVVRSGTEEAAIRSIERGPMPESMAREKASYEIITESIDAALKNLPEHERRFVQRHYFEGADISDIADEVSASVSFVYEIRKGVFDKLLISLSAIEDL